jgi:gas vesicle protein
MDKKLTTGLVIGGLLGGTLVALLTCKKSRELGSKALDYAGEIFGELQKRAGELGDLTAQRFNDLAEEAAEEYAKKKELAISVKDKIVEQLENKWNEYQAEQVFRDIKKQFGQAEGKTEKAFQDLIEKVGSEFADKKEMVQSSKNKLLRELRGRWKEVKELASKEE